MDAEDQLVEKLASQFISSTYTNVRSNSCSVASLTVLILECVQTFELERELIWALKWNHIELMYLFNRYFPLAVLSVLVYYNSTPPYLSPSACQMLFSIPSMGIAVCILVADVLLYLRLYALSQRTKLIKLFLIVNATAVIAICMIFFSLYLSSYEFIESPYPQLTGCLGLTHGASHYILICYSALFYSSIVTMVLSLYYGLRLYWNSRQSRLIQILYRDGAFYFITIALMSIANGVVAMAARSRYRFLLAAPQGVAHNILAARMILHLRETARAEMEKRAHSESTTSPAWDFATVPGSDSKNGTDGIELNTHCDDM
ncbi:hypothetical protein BKA70DRAFT_1111303 [Coprinopsis sp. MPI-PUGE-AT-0042]|nr:hypothetical protein BKA70DRAFT_1111303 [Coprinopsis sp. MPI-PUGE-AT-0042]